ncbi:unnamed protein product [Prunus armeniaca]
MVVITSDIVNTCAKWLVSQGNRPPQVRFGPPAQTMQPGQALGSTSPGKPKGRSCLGFSPKALTSVVMLR